MTRACSSIHALRRIAYPGGQGCVDVLHTQAAQSRVQLPAAVGEGHGAMVGEVVLQQHVAVKTTHIRYGDDAAAAERAILRVQHFTLGNIGAEPAVARGGKKIGLGRYRAQLGSYAPRKKFVKG